MGIDARGHARRVDLRAVFQPHADRPAAIGEDRTHRRLAANLDTQIVTRLFQRRRQPTHPTANVTPDAPRPARFTHHVVQEHVRASRRADRQERADDRVGGERRLQNVALEPAVENRPGRAREQLDRLRQIGTQIAERPVESPELFAVAEPLAHADMAPLVGQRQRVGCRLAEHRLEHRGHPLQKRVVARILDGIFHAELGDLAVAEREVGPHRQAAAIGQRRERRRRARQNLEPVFPQLQLADDFREKQADHIGGGRDLVARPELLGGRAAAQHVPPLEHAHLLPGPGQIRGANQSVVSAADDDCVKLSR